MPDVRDAGVIRAAGALVWRPGPDGPMVALVHRPRYDDWSYPKGKCDRGEHPLTTAIREVTEETGTRVVLGRPLTPSLYDSDGTPKLVSYWVARYVESVGFVPGHEVDEVRWLTVAQARQRLSYERDLALLDEFLAAPVVSSPLILLRHAAAGRKSQNGPDDLARPLDPRGTADAKVLAGLLASFGPCRVLTSAAERCVATVRPYAAAIGVPVEIEPGLTVVPDLSPADGYRAIAPGHGVRRDKKAKKPGKARKSADPGESGSRASRPGRLAAEPPGGWRNGDQPPEPPAPGPLGEGADLVAGPATWQGGQGSALVARLAAAGTPAVVCAHRENLPALIDAAFAALGASAPDSPPVRKGAFWALHSSGGVLVASERHEVAE